MPLQETCFLCDGQILSQKKIKVCCHVETFDQKVSCGEPSSNLRKETTLEKETGEKGRKREGFGREVFYREGHREVGRHHRSPV